MSVSAVFYFIFGYDKRGIAKHVFLGCLKSYVLKTVWSYKDMPPDSVTPLKTALSINNGVWSIHKTKIKRALSV